MAGNEPGIQGLEPILSRLEAVKDALTVRRVFGDAYSVDDVTVIPVAAVRGGGGGGGGEGTDGGSQATGSGGGIGFGVNVRPVGAYVIRNGDVEWEPAVDVMRMVIGGQLLALVALLTLRSYLRHRRRRRPRAPSA